MDQRFVDSKTAFLHKAATGRSAVLVYGDEVTTDARPAAAGCTEKRAVARAESTSSASGPRRSLEIYFIIDVGQGDSTFVVTPGGKTILVGGVINWWYDSRLS